MHCNTIFRCVNKGYEGGDSWRLKGASNLVDDASGLPTLLCATCLVQGGRRDVAQVVFTGHSRDRGNGNEEASRLFGA